MHVMIDLETLGTDPEEAPIIQIGAVAFRLDEDGPAAGVPYYRGMVSAQSCLDHPFHRQISIGTIVFWLSTDPELLLTLLQDPARIDLREALGELGLWMVRCEEPIEGVWGNGATFDISMLEMAYKQAGLVPPWHFRTVRDVRTMAMIAGDDEGCWKGGTVTTSEATGRKHDAVVDCLRQLRMVQQTWQRRVRPVEQTVGA